MTYTRSPSVKPISTMLESSPTPGAERTTRFVTITRPMVSFANTPSAEGDGTASVLAVGPGSPVVPADDAADSRGEPEDGDADGSDTAAGAHALNAIASAQLASTRRPGCVATFFRGIQ